MVGGGDPFYLKFWVNWPLLERNRSVARNMYIRLHLARAIFECSEKSSTTK